MATSQNANGFGATARSQPRVAAQSELGSRRRCWRSAYPVGWLCRLSLTIRDGRQRYHLASRLDRADHLTALGHAVGSIRAFGFCIAALAIGLRRVSAIALHRLHAIGHIRVRVSRHHRSMWFARLHCRKRRCDRRERQCESDQYREECAGSVQRRSPSSHQCIMKSLAATFNTRLSAPHTNGPMTAPTH